MDGYEAVKTGSKMAARYRASMGEVEEDAITDDGCGRCDLWWLAKELRGGRQHMQGGRMGSSNTTLSVRRQSADQSTTRPARPV